jgi:tetratricopeptide (TPR) repeat protein
MFRLGRREEADALWKQALALMDRMTDREKYRTLGSYYLGIVENYEQAVDNYSKLVTAYPADVVGHNNLALAYFHLLDFKKTMAEGKAALDLAPGNVAVRDNYALYAMYAGAFDQAANEAKRVIKQQPTLAVARLPVAIEAAVGRSDFAAADGAYADMAQASATGASLASIGRADLELYRGQIEAAIAELKTGISADVAAKSTTNAALKYLALAEAHLSAGRKPQAIDAAHQALALTKQLATVVPAARVLLHAGKVDEAKALAGELEEQLQKQNRAYGKILLAEIAMEEKKGATAVDLLTQARALADVWLGRFDLGVAYIQAGGFAEALPELELCEKRKGEATALFLNDRPTVRYLATLPYWIGRAQEGLNMAAPAKTRYEEFLKLRKDAAGDPLVLDARRRISGL